MSEARPDPEACGRDSDGAMKKINMPTTTHAVPSQCQMDCQATPCSSQGPTTNWPAAPPSIPIHCVTPMAVASHRAENPCAAKYTAPVNANAEPAPCSNLPV